MSNKQNIPLEDVLKSGARYNFNDFNVLLISGPDSENYLNSQTTNNVKTLGENSFQFNSLLDISGKIISTFILLKKSSEEIYLLVEKENLEKCLDRLNKFHISEELEMHKTSKKPSLYLGLNLENKNSFHGSYILPNALIGFEPDLFDLPLVEEKLFDEYRLSMGIPKLGREVGVGELISNTYFDELCVDYSKGCFPGQETVAKIYTRRGAAFKPVLLRMNSSSKFVGETIKIDSKKIGKILSYVNDEYMYASVIREVRIDKKDFFAEVNENEVKIQVKYLPLYDLSKESLSEMFYDRALTKFHSDDTDAAIADFKMAIKSNPVFQDAYESLGVVYGRLEKYDLAIKLMNELKNLNKKCMMAYTNLSLYHMKIGQIEKAEEYKSEATLLNFELLGDEAERKREEKRREEALLSEIDHRKSMFAAVLEIDEDDAMANNGLAEILLKEKNYSRAVNHFKKALATNAKYSVAYLGLAKTLIQMENINEAKDILAEGIKVASKNGDLMPANEMQSILLNL